jgi:tRNA (cmo5U34)-methyltransferase
MRPKSSAEQIRQRFDAAVEKQPNFAPNSSAIIDEALMLDLVVQSAATTNPNATHILDIGCGTGNYSLHLLKFCHR